MRVAVSHQLGKRHTFPHLNLRCCTEILYGALCILVYLLRFVSPNSSWRNGLREKVDHFPNVPLVSLRDMGFPSQHLVIANIASPQSARPLLPILGTRFKLRGVFVVQVIGRQAIVVPSYWPHPADTTEASQHAEAMQRYGVEPLDAEP